MRWRVRIVKRNAVKVDVVIAVGEAAKVSLALPESDAVAAGCKRAGNDLDNFAVVGDRRGEVLYISV